MEKLLKSIGKIFQAIISSEFFWLVVGALAAYSLAQVAIHGRDAPIAIPVIKNWIGALHLFLIALALILIKILAWLAQQEKLIEVLAKIIEKVFSVQTFWLIILALAIFGLVEMLGITNVIADESPLVSPELITLVAASLLLAKIVIWVVRRVIARHFL
jgi:hypothetical protein